MRTITIFLVLILISGCAEFAAKGKWQATERANITLSEAHSFCEKLHSVEELTFQHIYYNQCLESKGFAYLKDSNKIFECKHQCKAQYRTISSMEKQFDCLDKCELLQ